MKDAFFSAIWVIGYGFGLIVFLASLEYLTIQKAFLFNIAGGVIAFCLFLIINKIRSR